MPPGSSARTHAPAAKFSGYPPREPGLEHFPVKGGVYTIRDIRVDACDVALILHEVVNQPCQWTGDNIGELAFLSRRFRPAKPTGLAVFEMLLAPRPVKAGV